MLAFNHLVMKYFLLKRLKQHHTDIWQRMGNPTIFSIRESHWTLIGVNGDFSLCAQLGVDDSSRGTRRQIYRYRVLSALEILVLVGVFVALYVEH